MILQNATSSNQPFNGLESINPSFFGATTIHGTGATSFEVLPPPITEAVTVQPPPIVRDGIVVEFPPYTQAVTIQPPPKTVVIPGTGDSVRNSYESVGIINPGGQIRLCALVRPNVIAAAAHYNVPPYQSYIGMEVLFIGAGGVERARIVRVALTRADFECYYLDRSISAVKPAEIAPLESQPLYTGRTVIIFGLASLVRPIAGATILKFALANGSIWTAQASNKSTSALVIERGDSGSPAFFPTPTGPRYLGSLASVNLTTININLASPHVSDINAL